MTTTEPADKDTSQPVTRRYLRPKDEAKRIGISRRTLTSWMKNGTVPFIRRGGTILFDPAKVDTALAHFETREVTRS